MKSAKGGQDKDAGDPLGPATSDRESAAAGLSEVLPPEAAPSLPAEDSPSTADLLAALRQNEALLMQWLQALHQQMTNVYPWLQSLGGQITGLQQAVAQLQADMKAQAAVPPPKPVAANPAPAPRPASPESSGGFSLEGLASNIGQALQSITGSGDQPARTAAKAGDDANWDAVFFGRDLSAAPQLAAPRQELVRDLKAGQPDAQALVGLLLLFRGSSAEKMPVLLKDLGEAWYRWRPESAHGEDPLRQSLIRWLEGQCDSHGANNRIELVRPGDRFDSKKHNARDPGVEVAEVNGWVVLRDNGRIYTKANVVAR